jgi:hypothetical protein
VIPSWRALAVLAAFVVSPALPVGTGGALLLGVAAGVVLAVFGWAALVRAIEGRPR